MTHNKVKNLNKSSTLQIEQNRKGKSRTLYKWACKQRDSPLLPPPMMTFLSKAEKPRDWLIDAKRESSSYLPCSSCHLELSERSWKTSQQQFKDMENLEATKDQRDSSHLSCSSSHLDLSERSLENLATTNKRRDESWSGDEKQTKHTEQQKQQKNNFKIDDCHSIARISSGAHFPCKHHSRSFWDLCEWILEEEMKPCQTDWSDCLTQNGTQHEIFYVITIFNLD